VKTLDARSRRLLRDLIARYIEAGEPVASGVLARECGLDLSPATVRNVLSELEAEGFLRSPHTSAGRVPTAQGYRLYVDSLIEIETPAPLVDSIQSRLPASGTPDQVLRSASRLLSELTGCAGIVSVPRRDQLLLRQIEFVPLDERRLLVILVFADGQVQNRLAQVERAPSPDLLLRAARVLNERFAGRTLADAHGALSAEIEALERNLAAVAEPMLDAAGSVMAGEREAELLVAGEARLAACAELVNARRLQEVLAALEQQRDVLALVERTLAADDVRLFIGDESGYQPLAGCSVVTAPYRRGSTPIGVLGVIGPIRIDYQRVIPVVRATAEAVGQLLNPS
jgi:heat-inducible transcriptional repressor